MPEFVLDCPSCSGSLVFRAAAHRHQGRLYARCAACDAAYSLWGGRLQPVEGPVQRSVRLPREPVR